MKEYKVKFTGVIAVLAYCLALPLAAQEKAVVASTNLHSLWKVEGKSNTVYLMGSIHLLKPDNFPLAPALETAFSNAQVVAFETDIEKMSDPQTQMKLLGKAQLPEGETLKQHLTAETYAGFVSHAKDSGVPMPMLESMKPSMAAMVLSVVEVTKLGADPENGLDKYFNGKARKAGKEVIGLETVDFQIDMVTGFSKDEEDAMMKSALKDLDQLKQKYGEIVAAWQVGNSVAIEKFLNESMVQEPTIYKRLITDRNKSWIPKIEELGSGGKNAIVIVGAGHLVGKEGVVELLKKKGLKVTQL